MSAHGEEQRAAVLALPVLPLSRHGRLAVGDDGDVLLSVSVGPAGEAVALWSAPADQEALTSVTVESGWASFPDARAARPAGARITLHGPSLAAVVRVAVMPLAHATVQPLPGGRFLVVGARCRWHPEGPDRNAIVYDMDGTMVSEDTYGDGIEDVFTTATGQVWVSYFDEGVYGNYGWAGPGPQPLGSCGLIRFASDGQPAWRFPPGVAPPVDDCYALNVAGETAWVCYYSDFPMVRISQGRLTVWDNHVARGATTLIVDDRRVGLVGGYRPNRDRLALGQFGGGDLHSLGEYRLVLPDGEPLPERVRMVGRGAELHVFHGTDWYRLSLDDLPPGR